MPIHKDFEKFHELAPHERERAFQREIIIPLLQRLGFSIVWDNHGRDEKGNDVVFAEIDRLGGLVHYGMQVKYREQIGKGDSQELIDDVREAFTCPFHDSRRGEQGYISRFYIINAGNLSPDVADSVRHGITTWTPACNVRFMDGDTLATLAKWAAYQRGMFLREQLTGLILELTANRSTLTELQPQIPLKGLLGDVLPHAALRLAATSGYLERPILTNRIPVEIVVKSWIRMTHLIEFQRWLSNPLTDKRASPELIGKITTLIEEAIGCIDYITPLLNDVLHELEDVSLPSDSQEAGTLAANTGIEP